MSQVVKFHGAMRPPKRGPLTEAELDAAIAGNRERYEEAHRPGLRMAPLRKRVPLDNSLLARAIRALRWTLRLKGPKL